MADGPARLDRAVLDVVETVRLEFRDPTEEDPWRTSPFRWFRDLPSASKGTAGERLFSQWARERGLAVERVPDAEADRKVDDRRVEVKTSTRWKSGIFKFQQIRDQDYAVIVFLGICPHDVRLWALPKAVARRHARGQHGGSEATETGWIEFPADRPPAWLAPYGGTLDEGLEVLERLLESPASGQLTSSTSSRK